MNKLFIALLPGMFALSAYAQTAPEAQPYGKVDMADLQMTSCDFEKDANAMYLFEKGDFYYDDQIDIIGEYHKRIKIFNDNGKDVANIRIEFYGGDRSENITGLQAETINLVDGKIEITKLDKKLIYLQHIDKQRDVYVFSMPNVKAGSIIEYKYKWTNLAYFDIPDWYYQESIPVRYSELDTEIPEMLYFKVQTRVNTPFLKNSKTVISRSIGSGQESTPYNSDRTVRAMANIHSLPDEPYINSKEDNLQKESYQLTTIAPLRGFQRSFRDTWAKVGGYLIDDEDFGGQLKRSLANEDGIIAKAKAFKTDDERIAFVFDTVRNAMKWNGIDSWYTSDGTSKAWDNKSGNSAEVNLILYHLLKKSGLKVYPMVVSTRDHGVANPYYPNLRQFNRTVAYIPVDSTKRYILDATGKYNLYNETPANLLNSGGLYVDKQENTYDLLFLQKPEPVRQIALINAEIKPDGKMDGTVQLNSFSYNRVNAIQRYKTDGEKKYFDYLSQGDNNLKITSVKFDNMAIDTLPLTQNINFNLDLTGSDGTYIYFSPNIFTGIHTSPFLSESRYTDIDFAFKTNYMANGIYKEPAGYKVDGLPKSVTMAMPDKSIIFKRVAAEQDGQIVIRYIIDVKKPIYLKETYPELHEFFKKMVELMNEQVVLKKV